MISVGVDVPRLGLMTVAGQPKTTAEYIQATSRVGRAHPGLVCTVFNWARPRDLSHYEHFAHYHATFYQQVEALSVTPFAPRALDRGLASILVGLVRLAGADFAANAGASKLLYEHPLVERALAAIAARAVGVNGLAIRERVTQDLRELVDSWVTQARNTAGGQTLGYRSRKGRPDARPAQRPGAGRVAAFHLPDVAARGRAAGRAGARRPQPGRGAGLGDRAGRRGGGGGGMRTATPRRRVGEVRPSQILFTYGVGAIVDLPNLAALVMGLEDWDIAYAPEIGEERLLAAVREQLGPQVERLRSTPYAKDDSWSNPFDPAAQVGVPVAAFPRWMVCPYCRLLAPLKSALFRLKIDPYHADRTRYVHENCSKPGPPPTVLPARFLVACKAGHLDDFPWGLVRA